MNLRAFPVLVLLAACAHTPEPTPSPATNAPLGYDANAAAVAMPDRSEADRALDEGRKPSQMLSFLGVVPGVRVAELGAGGGYTAELLARAIGTDGKVYGQNTPQMLAMFAEKPWSERLAKPVNAGIVRLDTPADAPFPANFADTGKLDAVLFVLGYHDLIALKADRAAMNAAIFAALRPGGVYGVVDHAAKEGDGVSVADTLHRIDEKVVIAEVTAAGFKLDASADFLRNPADTHDWSTSPRVAAERRGTSDRFVLRFVKPQ